MVNWLTCKSTSWRECGPESKKAAWSFSLRPSHKQHPGFEYRTNFLVFSEEEKEEKASGTKIIHPNIEYKWEAWNRWLVPSSFSICFLAMWLFLFHLLDMLFLIGNVTFELLNVSCTLLQSHASTVVFLAILSITIARVRMSWRWSDYLACGTGTALGHQMLVEF